MNPPGRGERGVALIIALLIVAIAAGLATGMIVQNQRAIESTTAIFEAGQAERMAESGIELARAMLGADETDVDGPEDDWARPLSEVPMEGGTVSLRVIDLQGRLNLNDLVNEEDKISPLARERLRALFRELGIPPERLDAVADWIDANQIPTAAGAEDGAYLGRNPAYRSADRPLRSVTELLAIGGFTAEEYRRLAPHVSALPAGTPLNLNSATEAVVAALGDGRGSPADEREPAGSVAQALAAPPWQGGNLQQEAGLSVASRYFLCAVTVQLGETVTRRRFAVIERDGSGQTRIIAMSNEPCLNGHYCI